MKWLFLIFAIINIGITICLIKIFKLWDELSKLKSKKHLHKIKGRLKLSDDYKQIVKIIYMKDGDEAEIVFSEDVPNEERHKKITDLIEEIDLQRK